MKMFLFFSHTLTGEQVDDAKGLGVDDFVKLSQDLQERFSNVPPELERLDEYVRPFEEFLSKEAKEGDLVLIQGDFGVVYHLVNFAKEKGLVTVYATTKRVVKEIEKDSKKVKISEFKHIRFREYGL
jgi:hypothetical protein